MSTPQTWHSVSKSRTFEEGLWKQSGAKMLLIKLGEEDCYFTCQKNIAPVQQANPVHLPCSALIKRGLWLDWVIGLGPIDQSE